MTDSLRLGQTEDGRSVDLSLPGLFSSRLLVQADSGGGKSYMLRLIAERIAGLRQFIIVDIEGEFSTLRGSVKDLVVVGGDAGDVPLNAEAAAALAGMIRERRFSAVVDLSDLSTTDQRRYARDFLDGLIHAPKELWHPCVVIVDEAHELAPESGKGESCATEAVARLMKRGRKRNLAGVAATQRFSSLNKEVANLCRSMLVGPTAPMDTSRASDLMGVPKREADTLATLDPGEWIGRGPAISRLAVRFTANLPQTRPPAPGVSSEPPSPVGAMKRLAAEIAKLGPPKPPEDDPETLKATIAELRRQVDRRLDDRQGPDPDEVNRLITAALADRDRYWSGKFAEPRSFLENVARKVAEAVNAIEGIEKAASAAEECLKFYEDQQPPGQNFSPPKLNGQASPNPSAPHTQSLRVASRPTPTENGSIKLSKKQQEIIDAIAWWESIDRPEPKNLEVGCIANLDTTGGYFSNLVGPLSSAGYVERGSGTLRLTAAGRRLARPVEKVRTIADYHEMIRERVRRSRNANGKSLAILDALILARGRELTNDQIGKAVGMDTSGGYFSNSVGPLSTLGLIDRRAGVVRPTTLLFPPHLL